MTGDRELRRAVQDALQSVQPSPAPLGAIIRRGKRSRLRRTGAAAGGLALAGIIAVAALAPHAGTAHPAAASTGSVAPGGVIARGTASGHLWRLDAQDIADPGYACVPAIVLNGTDADPVYPDPVTAGVVALSSAVPGVGFAFVQLPADVSSIVVDGQAVPAVKVAACGLQYHVAGFAYSLAKPLQVTVVNPPPDWPSAFTMPVLSTEPPSKTVAPQTAGLWINTGSVRGTAASGTVAWGSLPDGQEWVIKVQLGTGGDCFEIDAPGTAGSSQMGSCGPVSTPAGPETIMALPIGFPLPGAGSATGYAVQLSPGTGELKATLSDGSSPPVAYCVVVGRIYAAFLVRSPLHLSRLTWLDNSGRAIASTTALPRYGDVQFQP